MTANESKTTYEYDEAGRLIRYKWIVPCGDSSIQHVETTSYDDAGRVVNVVKTSQHLFRFSPLTAAEVERLSVAARDGLRAQRIARLDRALTDLVAACKSGAEPERQRLWADARAMGDELFPGEKS